MGIERRAKERVKILETTDREFRQRESDIKKEIKRQLCVVAKIERRETESVTIQEKEDREFRQRENVVKKEIPEETSAIGYAVACKLRLDKKP